jgi:DNA-binding protein H-NS
MKTRILLTSALVSLLMAGSAFAMDSEAIEKKRQEIRERADKASERGSRVEALETQVEELQELIKMMVTPQDQEESS